MDEDIRAAVLTSSDGAYHGEREDVSGEKLKTLLGSLGVIDDYRILPDDAVALEKQLWVWVRQGIHVIASTGGTGLGPRDVMPEVTGRIITRDIPGMAEAMRAESLRYTPFGMISRGRVGVAEHTLIINFPGSPQAIEQIWPVVAPVIPHLVRLIHGDTQHSSGDSQQH